MSLQKAFNIFSSTITLLPYHSDISLYHNFRKLFILWGILLCQWYTGFQYRIQFYLHFKSIKSLLCCFKRIGHTLNVLSRYIDQLVFKMEGKRAMLTWTVQALVAWTLWVFYHSSIVVIPVCKILLLKPFQGKTLNWSDML